jgi:hypothetical protein
MTRSELLRAARARGVKVAAHQVDYLVFAGKLEPAPRLDGSLRRVYEAAHVDQVVAHARRRLKAGV